MDKKDAIKCLKSIQRWVPDWDGREDGLSYWDAIDMAIAALDTPNAEKPPCYLPEKDNPYPLCEGRGMNACAHCCLWEDYAPGEDESRVNQPLTLWRLREMDGEPVWVVYDQDAAKTTPGFDPLTLWALVEVTKTSVFLTNNFGGRTVYADDQDLEWAGITVYRRPPEGEEDT